MEQSRDLIPEDVLLSTVKAFLDAQVSSSDVLDGKAAQAVAVGTASLPLTIALVNATDGAGQRLTGESFWTGSFWQWDRLPIAFFLLALICYGVMLAWNQRLARAGTGFGGDETGVQYQPAMAATLAAYEEMRTQASGGRGLEEWVARYYIASTQANQTLLADKGKRVDRITLALALEGIALAIGAALALTL